MGDPDPTTVNERTTEGAAIPGEGEIVSNLYRVLRVIGSGGMGVVVKALRLTDQKFVALKFLRAEGAYHWSRFAREAEAARKLSGPHIARVLDADGLAATPPYIAFELLEGATLDELARERGPMPPREAVNLALQTCEALAEAHAQGIVHRDIKPSNLFVVSRDGAPFVKVLDFGISKLEIEAGDVSLTTSSTVIGSPSYASPEQLARPRAVDHRTDVWSVGVTMYRLLTGRVPFAGETAPEVHAKVLGATPPPVSATVPNVPRDLDAIVQRCLEKEPANRFQNVRELAAALSNVAWSDIGPARPPAPTPTAAAVAAAADPPRARRHTAVLLAGLAIVLVAGAVVTWRARSHVTPSSADTNVITPGPAASLEPTIAPPFDLAPTASTSMAAPVASEPPAASASNTARASSHRTTPPTPKRPATTPRATTKVAPQPLDPGDHR